MQDTFEIEDGSNDKAYFTMVPNIVLNHSTANDQALYMQMKRFAGEKNGGGYCTASKRTLMQKLGIGIKALNTSIDYLVEHKWVSIAGTRKVMTDGGLQDIQIFRVNDIWKLNANHYKGVAESTPLNEGALESTQGALERRQGVAESTTTKNYIKQIELGERSSLGYEESDAAPEIERVTTKPKYPHSKEVFSWFPHPEPSWKTNTTELVHAELLFERGEEAVRGALSYVAKHKDDDFFYKITKPSDLERKWVDLVNHKPV
jgi:hypothetical protein